MSPGIVDSPFLLCFSLHWQPLSPAMRDYKYNPRITNRTVGAFCSASCPSCYNLCHGNEPPAFHSLNILSTPFVYSVPTFGWVDGFLCHSWIKIWKSWPALGWPRILSGSEWYSSVLEGFNRNTNHLMSTLSGNLKSKNHTPVKFYHQILKKVDRFSTLDECSPVVIELFLWFIQVVWVEYLLCARH